MGVSILLALAILVAAAADGAASVAQPRDRSLGDQKWDHNYSCIFEPGKSFTYLHIAYVAYFNITYKAPTYCSAADCLDSCTTDCSCSAVVFDSPTTSCYQYHDLIPVQSIPFIPVRSGDTITAYIKVQNGYSAGASDFSPSALRSRLLAFWVAAALIWVAR